MRQVRIGAILSIIYTVTHTIVNLLYVPVLLKWIGQSEYGLYQLVGSIIAYISVMQSLLSAGILRYYCMYKALGDEVMMENTLAISKRIYYVFSLIVVVAGLVLSIGFKKFYQSSIDQKELREAQIMIMILTANIVVNLTNFVYLAAITANERFVFLKLLDIATTILQPVVIILVIRHLPYAITVVGIQLIINLIVAVTRLIYSKKVIKVKVIYHGKDKALTKSILVFSLGVFFAALADQLFWKADQIILGKLYGTTIVAIYAVGSQMYTNYMTVGLSVSGVFLPKVTQIYNKEKNEEGLSKIFSKVGRISFLLAALILCGFTLFGQEFIALWAGEEFSEAYYVALIVMIPFTVDIIQNIGLTILQVINKYTFRGVMYFVIALINIVGTFFMAKYWGMTGAAIATAISMFIGNCLIMNVYYKCVAKLDIKNFWIEILKMLPGILLTLCLGYAIKLISISNIWIELLVHIILFVIIYSICCYFFVLNKYEKSIILNFKNKIKRMMRKNYKGQE